MECFSNGILDLMAPFVVLLMTHMHALVTILKFQIIQIGITTLPVETMLQDSCIAMPVYKARDQTFGLLDGQPDARHVDQMSFFLMELLETCNATQMEKIIMILQLLHGNIHQHIKTIPQLWERNKEVASQLSPIGLPRKKPLHLEDAQEQLIALIGDTQVKNHMIDRLKCLNHFLR